MEPTPRVLRDRLGEWLLIKYTTGPDLDLEDFAPTVANEARARTELLYLDQIGVYGIVVRKVADGSSESISWGAILGIQDVEAVQPDSAA